MWLIASDKMSRISIDRFSTISIKEMEMIQKMFMLIISSLMFNSIFGTKVLREYIVKRDLESGNKASQFSVYADTAQKNLTYRIESDFNPLPTIDLKTYPNRMIIGRLDAQQIGSSYEARFEIKGTRNATDSWFTGHIRREFAWLNEYFKIQLAERTLIMKSRFTSSRFRFFDETKKVIAIFKKKTRTFSRQIWYELQIFSNQFPDGIYFFGIAAFDHQ